VKVVVSFVTITATFLEGLGKGVTEALVTVVAVALVAVVLYAHM
jgi:hypothetical protein